MDRLMDIIKDKVDISTLSEGEAGVLYTRAMLACRQAKATPLHRAIDNTDFSGYLDHISNMLEYITVELQKHYFDSFIAR